MIGSWVGSNLGLGVKDYRAIFIFHDHNTMKKFIDSGWEFGGHADAAAKASDKGGAVGEEILLDNITIYQLTESGLAVQATIKGTKYWKDDALNFENHDLGWQLCYISAVRLKISKNV